MIHPQLLQSFAAIVLFGLVFHFRRFLRVHETVGERTVVSLAGGAAVAYAFIQLSPELQEAAGEFREATARFGRPALQVGVNLAMMYGFLAFYGLDRLVIPARGDRRPGRLPPMFLVHVVVFTAYTWIIGYMLVRSSERDGPSFGFYVAAMAMHFASVAHGLREEHGRLYDRIGAWALTGGCVLGWLGGLLVPLPVTATCLLLGGVGGGIIANTVISELPGEHDGRFGPFLLGALVYAAILILAR